MRTYRIARACHTPPMADKNKHVSYGCRYKLATMNNRKIAFSGIAEIFLRNPRQRRRTNRSFRGFGPLLSRYPRQRGSHRRPDGHRKSEMGTKPAAKSSRMSGIAAIFARNPRSDRPRAADCRGFWPLLSRYPRNGPLRGAAKLGCKRNRKAVLGDSAIFLAVSPTRAPSRAFRRCPNGRFRHFLAVSPMFHLAKGHPTTSGALVWGLRAQKCRRFGRFFGQISHNGLCAHSKMSLKWEK